MSDISLAYSVTRTELALADLLLQDPAAGYEVVRMGPGSRAWRRETIKSAYVHGETQVSAVLDIQTAPLVLRIKGATHSQADTRLDAVIDAFSQFVYYVGVIIDGVTWVWECFPADIGIDEGGEIGKFHWMAKMFEVTLSIPRNPIPVSGTV